MSKPQLHIAQGNIIGELFGYVPAVLKEYTEYWCIEYYVKNPITNEFKRKREKVTNYVARYGKSEARALLRVAVNQLNLKLSQGWSPFFVQENTRLYEKLTTVAEKFLKDKEKDLRPNTMRCYKSGVNELVNFIKKNYPHITASIFDRGVAVQYMDFLSDKGRSNTHYNNHRKIMIAFFNWCVEKCYAKENPFERIKSKKKETKKRIIVTPEVRKQIAGHLQRENNIGMQIALNLIHQSLLRPKEVNEIQLKHIHLEEKYILVPPDVAKNHNERKATLSDKTIELIRQLNIEKLPQTYFLLGGGQRGHSLLPCKESANQNRISKNWVQLQRKLKFPKEMQLYSLRDTGIYEMLKSGIDDLSVMQHADHHSLEMTSRYAKHVDTRLVEKMNKLLPEF